MIADNKNFYDPVVNDLESHKFAVQTLIQSQYKDQTMILSCDISGVVCYRWIADVCIERIFFCLSNLPTQSIYRTAMCGKQSKFQCHSKVKFAVHKIWNIYYRRDRMEHWTFSRKQKRKIFFLNYSATFHLHRITTEMKKSFEGHLLGPGDAISMSENG